MLLIFTWLAASAPSLCILTLPAPDADAALVDIVAKSVIQDRKFFVPASVSACTRGDARCVLLQADQAKCGWVLHYGRSVYPAADGTKVPFFDAYDDSGRFRRQVCPHDGGLLRGCAAAGPGSAFNLVSSRFTAFGQVSYMQPGAMVLGPIFLGPDDIHWTLMEEPRRKLSMMHGRYSFRVPTIADALWIAALPGSEAHRGGGWLMLEGRGANGTLVVIAVSFVDEAERDAFADALHEAAARSVLTAAPPSAAP